MALDARKAEPGTEFGYTGNEFKEIGPDDEIPEGWTPTHYDPETDKRTIGRLGIQKTMKADDAGLVHPRDEFEASILDSFGLKVVRTTKAEKAEAAEKAKE
jgi:hypothetical protein